MNRGSTRTLLFGIFVVAARPLTATQLIALARPLGISETNVKSHLTRMVSDGSLRKTGPPRKALYEPGPGKREVIEGITLRLREPSDETWDGRWIMLAIRMPRTRPERNALRNALWFDGFRPWSSTTHIRPSWPLNWSLARARAHLGGGSGFCLHGALLGTVDLDRVRQMYRLDALDRQALHLVKDIGTRRRTVRSGSDAFLGLLEIGGRVARLMAHDPRLPGAIWGGRHGFRKLTNAYRDFERRMAPRADAFVTRVVRRESGEH